tara:strand:- start:33794 stop:34291 length:498 start_codon:yes stop_codon:yes gene_type:complete
MKTEKIKKGCGIALTILIIIIIGFFWMIKEAFGPTYKTVEIEKPFGKLICTEQYTADMADVFYDVDFKLLKENLDTLYLGNGIYNEDNWYEKIKLIKIEDWYGIVTAYSSHAKIGLTNEKNKEHINIVFNPLELQNNSSMERNARDGIQIYPTRKANTKCICGTF